MKQKEISAPVFNIQTCCIHDGPGIRVTVFVKGCPLHCLWCANPESNKEKPQLMTYESRCTGCGLCAAVCPQNAIRLQQKDGQTAAVTERKRCIDCGLCTGSCPNKAREIVGKETTVSEALSVILKDKLFMDASGGGMTISGGEALAHPEFSRELFRVSREAGIHTAIESCVFAPEAVVDRVFEYVDLGLLDIKHMDPEKHKVFTGADNQLILHNIRHIYHDLKVPVIIRVPVIPGYNDGEENMKALAAFAAGELGRDVEVNLLPYHRLGESKYESLGLSCKNAIEVPDIGHMEKLKKIMEASGLKVRIGG